MGKGGNLAVDSCAQESEVTPSYSQKQIITSSFHLPSTLGTNLLVTADWKFKNPLILPGSTIPVSGKVFASKEGRDEKLAFPDSSLPVTMFDNTVIAFSDSDETFTRILNGHDRSALFCDPSFFVNIRNAECFLRQCPGGRNGSSSGSGSYNSSYGSGAQGSSGGSWVLGGGGGSGGGLSGGLGGAGGGGDDDPWKNQYNIGSGPANSFIDDEEFNSFNYLDEAMLEDFLRDMPFPVDFVMNQQNFGVGFNRDPSINTYPSEEPSDPPSTPAPPLTPGPLTPAPMPHTPMVPMTPPSVTSHYVSQATVVNSPPTSSVQPSDQSETQTLFEIQKLMISSSTTLIPQPSLQPSLSTNTLLHQNQPSVRMPLTQPKQPIPQQSVPSPQRDNAIDFLASNVTCDVDKDQRVCELFVPPNLPREKSNIGYSALQHCYGMYMKYQDALKDNFPSELSVAVQRTAQLCAMSSTDIKPKLCFEIPKTCVPLSQWSQSSGEACDIAKRQLVLQQLINALVMLFKAPEELCFWGSAQILVDTNMKVFLYVDFIKCLAIQKEYAESRVQANPRVEDCKMLGEVYSAILKPYLQRDMTWVSPQLSNIFKTFEDLLVSPSSCVSNMACLARVLGERRICKLEAANGPFQYTIYCAEHETISSSLEVVSGVLPASVARVWAVLHSDSRPVGATEMATKQAHGYYHLWPVPDGQGRYPGALYIESKQRW